MAQRKSRPWFVIVAVAVFLVIALASTVATFYTDILWYQDVGQSEVFWTTLWSEVVTWAVFGLIAFLIVYVNVLVARTMAPSAFVSNESAMPEQVQDALVRIKTTLEPIVKWVLLGVALFIGFSAGAAMASQWRTFQLALHSVPFGVADPQFGKDVAFYVFTLPALRATFEWLFGILIVTLLVSAAVHFLDGSLRPWDRLAGVDPHVKAHLSVILGLIIASTAFDYWLKIYELNFSPRGQVRGASFTDVHAQIPAYYILMFIALVSFVLLLVNIRFRGWRLPIVAVGVWVLAVILVGNVYPGLVQSLRVAPNEIAAERPYIKRNIDSTRRAFGMNEIKLTPYAAELALTGQQVAANKTTVDNVRLWDPNIAKQTYKQLQEIRYYYDFNDVDIDRYTIDGQEREVIVSGREMNIGQLQAGAQTFVNQHLIYTHGYGAVVSPVNTADAQGLPLFIVKDLPPQSTSPATDIKRPGIYYGEETANYVVVNTNAKEFDYPAGESNARARYESDKGVEVGGFFRRLAFALRFGSLDFLLSGYIRSDSRVLYNRQLEQRVALLAPWLELDRDPYLAIIDGKLVWILDGYTATDHYPYSELYMGVSYVRNSVKVTIDAYDGTTTLYAFDPSDPIMQAWSKVFPGLLTEDKNMPQGVRAHLRYPEDLFRIQAEVFKTYHMLDPQTFYNKEDQWQSPGEAAGSPMAPFYVLMKLPDQTDEEFILMMPFTPRTKDNMIAWMAAKSDPGHYGQRVVYTFPKQRLILGPSQISARINQDPTISQQLSLWNQRGSRVLFGNMLVIPIEKSIMYVQPLFLESEQTPLPELTRVIVAHGDSVSMQPSLAQALAQVFGTTAGQPAPSGGATVTPVPGGGAASGLAAQAEDLYKRAIQAQRNGDWATYGKLVDQLGQVLGQMAKASKSTTGTAKP